MYDVTVEHNVAATMRDGTVLRADVYRPTAAGRWPVLLTRLPYGKHLPGLIRMTIDPLGMARGGYIVVVQDTRGRFASEGDWSHGHSRRTTATTACVGRRRSPARTASSGCSV